MDCKLSLASKMNSALRGIRGKRRELESKPDRIKEILLQGAKEARAAASSTLGEVREAMKVA
jgi:tryptophanyl-tRNA synthetase